MIRVEKYYEKLGFVHDSYDAEAWFLSHDGGLLIYLRDPEADEEPVILAEYGSGQFVRVIMDPPPVRTELVDEKGNQE